ncbi:MAG: anti-sigma F factor [Bacillota bacterium]
MEPVNKMKIQFSSLPVNVSFARVAAGAFAAQIDFTINDIEELKVAVSEAVTNSIVHGYDNDPGGAVELYAEIAGETLTIVVEDHGRGIEDINKAMQPAFSTDPERMGLGFSFMQSFSDRLEVHSSPGMGTRVKMTRKCRKEALPRPRS